MMNGDVRFILGSALCSGAVAYVLWTKVRVVDLRQDIYDIRDDLWDRAAVLNGFEDPAYKATREMLNGFARNAGLVSIPVLVYLLVNRADVESRPVEESPNVQLQGAIQRARERVAERLATYLVFETLLGWVLLAGSYIFGYSYAVVRECARTLQPWVRPGSPLTVGSPGRPATGLPVAS